MKRSEWLRVVSFWGLMGLFAAVLLKMRVFGIETELKRTLNFLPLALVIALFLFVWAADRRMRRKSPSEQERQTK